MEIAHVLNGVVRIGDTIAYSTRFSSSQSMHIAEILEIIDAESWSTRELKLKVRVTTSSDTSSTIGRIVTIGCLDRIVKIG